MIPRNIPGRFTHAVMVTGSRTWDDEVAMRRTFNEVWTTRWLDTGPRRPVLLSGACPTGADAIAERLWQAVGFEIVRFPAMWQKHGRAAGPARNAQMVDAAQVFRDSGTQVLCTAFIDYCDMAGCARRHQQLLPDVPGHFSHGATHCRGLALKAGLDVIDTLTSDLTAHSMAR